MTTLQSALGKARAHWTGELPDWSVILCQAIDRPGMSQAKVAKVIGYSASAVSCVLSNSYSAPLDGIEQAVRGRLMGARVDCPGLGESITTADCLDWQSTQVSTSNPLRVRMRRACRGCPNNRRARHAE